MNRLAQLLSSTLLCSMPAVTTLGHSPHDVIETVALSPNYSEDKLVFAVLGDQLKRSRDGGYSWQVLTNGLDARYSLRSVAVSGGLGNDRTVFVTAGRDGVYRSTNAGDSWQRVVAGLEDVVVDLML